ncbi:hypothetical protein [Paracidovorax citrulli]
MTLSPVSHGSWQTQPAIAHGDSAERTRSPSASAGTTATASAAGEPGKLDLFAAEKLYREKADSLAKLSNDNGRYAVDTLTDSEIKSLKDAGVPIDRFVKEYGQKLGSREYLALASLIMQTLEKQQGPTSAQTASATPAAVSLAGRNFV